MQYRYAICLIVVHYEGSDPNGIRTLYNDFAFLRDSAANAWQSDRYLLRNKMTPLLFSGRFMQLLCPKLSESPAPAGLRSVGTLNYAR